VAVTPVRVRLRLGRLSAYWVIVCAAVVAAAACSSAESTSGPEPDDAVAVVSFNIHHGAGVDGNVDLDRVASAIRATGADIVGLQEVDRHFDQRSQYQDQIEELAELLDMRSAFGASIDLDPSAGSTSRRQYGNAVLSRHPITSHTTTPLPTGDASEPRTALTATIDAPGGPLKVVVSHFSVDPDQERRDQAAALNQLVGDTPERTIVLVDANAGPDSQTLAALLGPLVDAWSVESGSGYTQPADDPRRRIDFVLTSPDLEPVSAQVPDTDASDHLPVSVVLEAPRPSG
jgi:endonuclease/exonuclease/phosphatase family metal-dependent hydrolase